MQPGAGRAGGAVGWGPWRRPHRACQDEQRLARHRGGGGEALPEGVLRVQRPRPGGAASGHAGRPGAEGCAGRGGRLSWAWSSGAMHRAWGSDLVRGWFLEGLGPGTTVPIMSVAQSGPRLPCGSSEVTSAVPQGRVTRARPGSAADRQEGRGEGMEKGQLDRAGSQACAGEGAAASSGPRRCRAAGGAVAGREGTQRCTPTLMGSAGHSGAPDPCVAPSHSL